MSNTKQKPLLSDDELREMRDNRSTISTYPVHAWLDGAMDIRDTYEAARAKDAELIQQLVDALAWYVEEDDVIEGDEFNHEIGGCWDEVNAPWIEGRNNASNVLAAAEAARFKPTKP